MQTLKLCCVLLIIFLLVQKDYKPHFVYMQQKWIAYYNSGMIKYINSHTFKTIEKHHKSLELNLETMTNSYFTFAPKFKHLYDNNILSTPATTREHLIKLLPFCHELLKLITPHITWNGKNVNFNDCCVIDVLNYSGAYFPKLHNDMEWTYLSENTPGFQVWYLIKNDENEKGNMFISKIHDKCGIQQISMTQNMLFFKNNGSILKNGSPSNDAFVASLKKPSLKYVNIKPGECLVFHKNLLHMSDPRKIDGKRVAINFRVAVCPKRKMTFRNVKNDMYLRFKNPNMKKYIDQIPTNANTYSFPVSQFELA